MSSLFAGIDLSSSEKRPSAVAVIAGAQIRYLGLIRTDAEIVALLREWRACAIGIDAPLSLPRGLCCLEESCPCQPIPPLKGRECERKLSRREIGSYYTTKRSFIKPMIYRAMGLKDTLDRLAFRVLEVYPYASKVCLWGKPIPKKGTPEGRAFLEERLSELFPDLNQGLAQGGISFDHDLADALIAAYTAYLADTGHAEAVGVPEEGVIHIPKVGVAAWAP